MASMGSRFPKWSKELDTKLLSEVTIGKSLIELVSSMGISSTSILRRLKVLGFLGLKDARKVMTG